MIFSKCALRPGAGLGILEHAAPHRIDQRDRRVQRLPRALDGGGVARFGAGDREIHAVGVDVFLHSRPSRRVFPRRTRRSSCVSAARCCLGEEGGGGGLDLKGFADRGAGRGIIDDRLQQRLHPRRLDIAPDLGDLGAIGGEHDGRRPAPIAVAAGQIRIGVLVDAHRQVFLRQQRLHLGVGVGGLFHHVAPVAPHRLEIEDDEALLGGGAGEQIVVPVAPFQFVGG